MSPQRHGSDTRATGSTDTTGYVVSVADRARYEDARQRRVLVGMDPEDTALLDEQDALDARDRLEDVGSTNGWSR